MKAEQGNSQQSQADYVLSIDNGAQSVRAMLFDTAGNGFALSRIEIEPYILTEPG